MNNITGPMNNITAEHHFAAVCLHNLIAVDLTVLTTEDVNNSDKMYKLPTENNEEGRLAIIPLRQTYPIPRQRRIPSAVPKTRWQKFAEEQNIHKRKRSRMLWDQQTKSWLPRWGKDSLANKKRKGEETIFELKDGEDLHTAVNEKRSKKKLEKKKQEFQQLRNKIEAKGGKLPQPEVLASVSCFGKEPVKKGKKALEEISRRLATSTASYGVYDKEMVLKKKYK